MIRAAALLTTVVLAATGAPPQPAGTAPARDASLPLTGRVVVVDPGHQLGNSRHLAQISRLVDAGGFRKACNSTGTATNAGYPARLIAPAS